MFELKRHQYFNLFHVFIVAPLIFLAIYPRYLSKVMVSPETFVKFMTGLIIVMVLFHTYRFITGFDGLVDKITAMFSKPASIPVTVVPAPPEPTPAPVIVKKEPKAESQPEVKPEEQSPVPMENFSTMF